MGIIQMNFGFPINCPEMDAYLPSHSLLIITLNIQDFNRRQIKLFSLKTHDSFFKNRTGCCNKARGPSQEQKLSLVVQNSKCGAVLVSKMKFNRLEWPQSYKFATSMDQNVEFVLIKGEQKQAQLEQNIIGRGKLYINKFMRMFGQEIAQKQKQHQEFQYQVTLSRQSKRQQVTVGVIKLSVSIDSTKGFQGQVITNANLDLRGELQSNPKFVKFYLGKTTKINIFSLLDQKVNTAQFRVLESIYRDIE